MRLIHEWSKISVVLLDIKTTTSTKYSPMANLIMSIKRTDG